MRTESGTDRKGSEGDGESIEVFIQDAGGCAGCGTIVSCTDSAGNGG